MLTCEGRQQKGEEDAARTERADLREAPMPPNSLEGFLDLKTQSSRNKVRNHHPDFDSKDVRSTLSSGSDTGYSIIV